MESFAFYIFAGVSLGSAIGAAISRNIVRTAVCLLGTLGGVAGLYFLLNANLLAVIQLIVYAGGTLILIVFGVMLTTKSPWVEMKPSRKQVAGAVVLALMLVSGLTMLMSRADWSTPSGTLLASPRVADVGRILLTDYLVPFEAASVLLLVVMIGAAYLARPEN
jgi:NADH:ubiquinone oxidoreductase subunit 6 (subunit J)